MKKKKILNLIAFGLVIVGMVFKGNHWPGASIAITLGVLTMLITLILFGFKENKEVGVKNALNYFLVGMLSLLIVGILFKIQHWPSAGVFIVCGYILGFILPLILIMQKSDFKLSRQFTITFFTYFILLITMFPKNPINQYFQGGEKTVQNDVALPVAQIQLFK